MVAQAQGTEQIARALVAAVEPGWSELRYVQQSAGGVGRMNVYVVRDGVETKMGSPAGAHLTARTMRGQMYQPGTGTWFSMELAVTDAGKVSTNFNYDDDPVFDPPIDPIAYAVDQDKFPRDPEHQPEWLRDRIAEGEARRAQQQPSAPSRDATSSSSEPSCRSPDLQTEGFESTKGAPSTNPLSRTDLPPLELMGRRWAVVAALSAAVLGDTGDRPTTGAQPHGWLYLDGGGSWAQVILLSQDRALLVGMDRDHSDTYRQQVDLTDGLPDWAMKFVPTGDDGARPWWGFTRLYVDGAWWCPDTRGVADGLDRLRLPALSAEDMVRCAADWLDGAADAHLLDDDPRADAAVDPKVVIRAVELGPDLDEATLLEVLVFDELDLGAGVAAARAFADVTAVPPGLTALPYRLGI